MLEGQARRSDATQKALQRYLGILQAKMREDGDQHATRPADTTNGDKGCDGSVDRNDRAERLLAKLNSESDALRDLVNATVTYAI